jgi:hypothetical protein
MSDECIAVLSSRVLHCLALVSPIEYRPGEIPLMDYVLASGCSQTPIGCLAFTMLANITQCVPNL